VINNSFYPDPLFPETRNLWVNKASSQEVVLVDSAVVTEVASEVVQVDSVVVTEVASAVAQVDSVVVTEVASVEEIEVDSVAEVVSVDSE